MNQNKLTNSLYKNGKLDAKWQKIKLAKTGNTKSEDRLV